MGKTPAPLRDLMDLESITETITRLVYEYEGVGANKVLKKKTAYNEEDILYIIEYTYDAQNDIIKKERISSWQGE